MKTYRGSCHCGAVRFEADVDFSKGVNKCNCSWCTKARSWFTIVQLDQLRVLAGQDAISDYRWKPEGHDQAIMFHAFCKTCSVRVFGGAGEAGHPRAFRYVCIAALDGVGDELAAAPVFIADGRHDRFDQRAEAPHQIG